MKKAKKPVSKHFKEKVVHKIIESQEKGQKQYELKHFNENIDHRTTISHEKDQK